MGWLKRFIYNRLFNKRQREAIWNAVLYSEHVYKRRGNVERAAEMRCVINETAKTAATKQRKFFESEVAEIVKQEVAKVAAKANTAIKNAYNEGKRAGEKSGEEKYSKRSYRFGFAEGKRQAIKEVYEAFHSKQGSPKCIQNSVSVSGFQVDVEKCKDCPNNADCLIYNAIKEAEKDAENQNNEGKVASKPEAETKPEDQNPSNEEQAQQPDSGDYDDDQENEENV